MFGYIRPHKAELLMKEFTRYRAVYCGLCKQIGELAGTLPRITVAYEITFLGLLLISLREEDTELEMEGCFKHLGRKHLIAQRDPVLEYCAALSVILAYYKLDDDVADGDRPILARLGKAGLAPGRSKVLNKYAELDRAVKQGLKRLTLLEQEEPGSGTLDEAAGIFGQVLYEALQLLPPEILPDERIRETVCIMGREMGRWIYAVDAQDDRSTDLKESRYNPLASLSDEEAADMAEDIQRRAEESLDLSAAILPYWRDANIISNVIQLGLPRVRQQVSAGVPLDRI